MWRINGKEYLSVLALNESKRYEYFIKRVADWGQVWSLKDNTGWVLYGDDKDNELVPAWPHPKYAQVCAIGEWQNAIPQAIEIHEWIERWIPGMIKDKRLVAVFPVPTNKGIRVSPERLKVDLERELENIE